MSVTDPLAAAITDAVVGAGMRVGRNRLQAVVEQAIRDYAESQAASRPSITNIEIPAALEAAAPRPPVSRPWLRRRKA